MAPVQSKLFPCKNLHQQSLIPVVASTPHGRAAKTWCICEMPEEDYNEEEMNMVQCQGATCKQRWFHYECIGKPQDWDPTNEDYYCAYCSRRK